MIKVLLLSANPTDTTRVRVDSEAREIDNALRQADFRDRFVIEKHFAVRVKDIQSLLLRHKPDIVHFSGHGNSESQIIVEDLTNNSHPISREALGKLFSILKDNICCVILNTCYSEPQAQAIVLSVDCVIGTSTVINDNAAISFSSSFYQALGYGRTIKEAFDLGCLEIDLEHFREQNILKLLTRDGFDPASFYLFLEEDTEQEISSSQSYQHYRDFIRSLLNESFTNKTQLDEFCQQYIDQVFEPHLPLRVRTERLMKHYEMYQGLNALQKHIEEFSKQQPNENINTSKQFIDKYLPFWRGFRSRIIGIIQVKLPRSRAEKVRSNGKSKATCTIEILFEDFDLESQAATVNGIAHKLGIPPKEIKVMDVHQGSTVLTIELPTEALDKLISMYETDRSLLLYDSGISYVMEAIDEPYKLKNIKAMLVEGFTLEQLIDFCNSNFRTVLEQLPSSASAETIADALITYASQNSQIATLLTLAQNINPKAYDGHRPYHEVPRRPNQKGQTSLARLTRREIFIATIRGLGTAILGSMIISAILLLSVYLGNAFPISDSLRDFYSLIESLLTSLAYMYLGDLVGSQVLAGAKYKRDSRLAILAVSCFILGSVVGAIYPFLFRESLSSYDNKPLVIIVLVIALPIILIGAICLLVFASLLDFRTLFSLLLGSFFAYRRVKWI